MDLVSNNLSPLPFYDDINLQNHRKDYAFGQVFDLITYSNFLLPFQICILKGSGVSEAYLYDFNTSKRVATILPTLKENGLAFKSYTGGIRVISYPGIFPINQIVHEGRYYIWMRINGGPVLYSEVFTVVNNIDNCLKLEYSNPYNFQLKNGIVDFSNNFKFKCYLQTQIGKPEYVFEEEATDRMGYTFIESQVSKKLYKFTFLAPEYLCDALRLVRLCQNRQITSKNQVYDLITFNIEPKWQEQGDLAAVDAEFETDTVIANIGGYQPELLGGDFNTDFNTDYKKS